MAAAEEESSRGDRRMDVEAGCGSETVAASPNFLSPVSFEHSQEKKSSVSYEDEEEDREDVTVPSTPLKGTNNDTDEASGKAKMSSEEEGANVVKGTCLCKNYWGIMLSLASGLASTFGGIIVKMMEDFHPFSLATYRFQGIVLPTLIILLYYKYVRKEDVFITIWPVTDSEKLKKFGFTIVRAVIGCLGLYLYFYAIKLMPLADAKVILSCRPVFVIFVARLFLGEPCGIFPVLCSMLAISGVFIISRPPVLTGHQQFDGDTLMGTVFATLSMLAASSSMVVLRYLRGVHVGIVTLAFGFWGSLLSLACSGAVERLDVPHTGRDWVLIVSLAVSAFFSQTAITLAMKYEHAGAVVIVGTADTIMSFVLQYFFLGVVPDLYSILGAALIIVCVSLITLRKWIDSLKPNNPIRKRFSFAFK